jgi:phage terminase large subunit-like protein
VGTVNKGSLKLSERAKRNIEWIEKHLPVPEGRLVGQPVKLSPAQRDWMEMIYGSATRTFICSLPRKNGKTSFSAMIVLLHLVGPEAVQSGQLYSAAQSRDQASILFSLAAKMVRMSPTISEYVTVKDSAKQLVCHALGTVYKALSADASTAMGLSPVLVIHDELGQVRGSRFDLYEALETASAAQARPLSIVISTQAANPDDLLSVLIDDALKSHDERVKCVLYAVPDDKDPFDIEQLKLAQPNWHLMNHEEIIRQMEEAKRMPSREASFRNLIANQRVETFSPFISGAVWKSCGDKPEPIGDNIVFGGLDLSSRADLTAFQLIWKTNNKWNVQSHFWTPKNGLIDRAKRDRTPYDVWVNNGFLHVTPGSTVDYEYVAEQIIQIVSGLNVKFIAYDRWRMEILRKEFTRNGVELPLVECGQGYKDMSPAIDTLESELLNGRLRHGMHPVLTMCAANAIVIKDQAGNRKIDKAKSTGRIDGLVALAMAFHAANMVEENDGDWDGFLSNPVALKH